MKVGDLVRSKYDYKAKAIVTYSEESRCATPDLIQIRWVSGPIKGMKCWYQTEDLEIFSESR